jgi:hypothetical protein
VDAAPHTGRFTELQIPYYRWELWLDLYLAPRGEVRFTIPFHRCEGAIEFPYPISDRLTFEEVSLRPHYTRGVKGQPSRKLSVTVESTRTEVHFTGPGNGLLIASARSQLAPTGRVPEVGVSVSLLPIRAERPVPINVALQATAPEGGASVVAAWLYGKHPREWRPDRGWEAKV